MLAPHCLQSVGIITNERLQFAHSRVGFVPFGLQRAHMQSINSTNNATNTWLAAPDMYHPTSGCLNKDMLACIQIMFHACVAWRKMHLARGHLLCGDNVHLGLLLGSCKIVWQASINTIGIQPAMQVISNPCVPHTAKQVHQLQSACVNQYSTVYVRREPVLLS